MDKESDKENKFFLELAKEKLNNKNKVNNTKEENVSENENVQNVKLDKILHILDFIGNKEHDEIIVNALITFLKGEFIDILNENDEFKRKYLVNGIDDKEKHRYDILMKDTNEVVLGVQLNRKQFQFLKDKIELIREFDVNGFIIWENKFSDVISQMVNGKHPDKQLPIKEDPFKLMVDRSLSVLNKKLSFYDLTDDDIVDDSIANSPVGNEVYKEMDKKKNDDFLKSLKKEDKKISKTKENKKNKKTVKNKK